LNRVSTQMPVQSLSTKSGLALNIAHEFTLHITNTLKLRFE
jgi:hypothetical protein